MAKMQKVIVTLLVLSIIFSIASVIFSVVIFNMSSEGDKILTNKRSSSNLGNVGFLVEGNSENYGGGDGG